MGAQDIKLDGATSQIIEVMIRDSTTGQGKTGIAFGSVTGRYIRQGAASATTITMATATMGTFTSGGWVEVDSTNCPGRYQLGVPNAAIAAGVDATTITFKISGAIDKDAILLLTPPVDSRYWSGTANATPDTAGFPKVTIKDGTGQGEIDTTAGAVATTGGSSLTAADVWAAATRTLTGGAAIITGDIEFTAKQIVRGNDYSSANQPWAESMSSSSITDLSAYAWVFTADKDADNLETGDATFVGTVVVTTATGSSRALRIDVAASLTDSLAKGYYNGAIRGTATSGSKLATPKFISVKVVDDPNQ